MSTKVEDRLDRAIELLEQLDMAIQCTRLDMGGAHEYHLSVVRARKLVPLIKEFLSETRS